MRKSHHIGVFGSGQLCYLFARVAIERGYKVFCFSPESNSPASKAGVNEWVGDYDNFQMVEKFLNQVSYVTFEFESIPKKLLRFIELYASRNKIVVAPNPKAIEIAQNRILEKSFFKKINLPTVEFFPICSFEDYEKCKHKLKFPCVLKKNNFGYDGKGQVKFSNIQDLDRFLSFQKKYDFCIEEFFQFEREVSIIIARFLNGTLIYYPPIENFHTDHHILSHSLYPADIKKEVIDKVSEYAESLISSLDYVGVMGVEFFIKGEEVVLNEFAPRTHNSGHFSVDACDFSQFDLQLYTLLDLPQPSHLNTTPALMKNIIGEDFYNLNFQKTKFFKDPSYHLHVYGKEEVRSKRKMGHWTYVSSEKIKYEKIDEIFS